MAFLALPTEIHMHITSHLDYISLLSLQSTSHYFHNLETFKQKQAALFELEQSAPGTPNPDRFTRLLIRHTHLPCYSCLKFLGPENHFEPHQTEGPRSLGQNNAHKRMCARCRFWRPTSVLVSSSLWVSCGLTYVSCVACQETTRYWGKTLDEQAWARGQLCVNCWWFKITPFTLPEEMSQYLQYEANRVVRVPTMDGKTAAMLIGEVSTRTNKRDTAEFKAMLSAIYKAVKLPNLRVTAPESEEERATYGGVANSPPHV